MISPVLTYTHAILKKTFVHQDSLVGNFIRQHLPGKSLRRLIQTQLFCLNIMVNDCYDFSQFYVNVLCHCKLHLRLIVKTISRKCKIPKKFIKKKPSANALPGYQLPQEQQKATTDDSRTC